jgi:hypothetical protein
MWGPGPVVAVRLEGRKFLHYVLLVGFVISALSGLAVTAVGSGANVTWLEYAGRAVLVLAAIPLGMEGPTFVRSLFTISDFYRWTAAGRPERWDLSPASQPRGSDLVWAAALTVFWAWFYIKLSLG